MRDGVTRSRVEECDICGHTLPRTEMVLVKAGYRCPSHTQGLKPGPACWPRHIDCEHREYIGQAVTLHGEPAKITMDIEGHPHVAPLDPEKGSVPYSWTAVFNICENHNGRFGS